MYITVDFENVSTGKKISYDHVIGITQNRSGGFFVMTAHHPTEYLPKDFIIKALDANFPELEGGD